MPRNKKKSLPIACLLTLIAMMIPNLRGQVLRDDSQPFKLELSGWVDGSYRRTQFFAPDYNDAFLQWDSRLELLPRQGFTWGPYLRFAGLLSDHSAAFENTFLAGPGAGFELYPFSPTVFHKSKPLGAIGNVLGPMRLFGEVERTNYFGIDNTWRPHDQVRAGFDYYSGINVNDLTKALWMEPYVAVIWQRANEFDGHYDATIFSAAFRGGLRLPNANAASWITPYVAVESSLTSHPGFFWENYLRVGGGIRITPPLATKPPANWMNRIVVYAEYLSMACYYRNSPAAGIQVPRDELRIGISIAVGDYFHE